MTDIKKQSEGFTIIEVLIVLAIAGLIMLIVFLAVPALQRNSRNTQRRNDVTAALGSFQEVINNNNGKLPATVAAGIANASYGFYDTAEFTGFTVAAANQPGITSTDSGVVINNFTKCGTVPAANVAVMPTDGAGFTKRSVTAVYRVEVVGGFQVQCVDM